VSYGGDGAVARELRWSVLCWRGGAREASGVVARRGWSTAAWAQGGRRRVMVARRGKGTAAHGWRPEKAQEAAALARARRRTAGDQRRRKRRRRWLGQGGMRANKGTACG